MLPISDFLFAKQHYLSTAYPGPNVINKFDISVASCGQSYKGSTIVNYDSRVIIWGNVKSGMTLEL